MKQVFKLLVLILAILGVVFIIKTIDNNIKIEIKLKHKKTYLRKQTSNNNNINTNQPSSNQQKQDQSSYYRKQDGVVMCGNYKSKLFLNSGLLVSPSKVTIKCIHSKQFYLCPEVKINTGLFNTTMYFLFNKDTMTGYLAYDASNLFNLNLCYHSHGILNEQIPGYVLCVMKKPKPFKCRIINNKNQTISNNQPFLIKLIHTTIPGKYHKTFNLQSYLIQYPNAILVIRIGGGEGGSVITDNHYYQGGLGGITVLKIPLLTFIKYFSKIVTFYYVVGGKANNIVLQKQINQDGQWSYWGAGGGGGASMVAVGNWPHDGGTTLAIVGGGGGSAGAFGTGGGGGGGNNPGQNGSGDVPGQGGGDGKGGDSGSSLGGIAKSHLIDICGGGGGGWSAPNGAGAGGGTAESGQNGSGNTIFSGKGGSGYQSGGSGGGNNTQYSSYNGGSPGIYKFHLGSAGGYGGGGGSSAGVDAGGGGGYGGGGGGWQAGGGGGGGYCNTSLATCQASDWTNGGGNYGNGYVKIYLQP